MDYVNDTQNVRKSQETSSSYKSGFLCNGEFILPEGSIVPDPLDGDGRQVVSVGEKLRIFAESALDFKVS